MKFQTYDISKATLPHPLTSDAHGFLCNAPLNDISTLLLAYRFGIFPWDEYREIGAFFFPRKRYIIIPSAIKISKSIRPYFNMHKFTVTLDQHFSKVISCCRHVERRNQESTWISTQFEKIYNQMHEAGFAHSLEVWKDDQMVGGLYGVAVGKVFTGESIFGLVPNASRFALISLAAILQDKGFKLLDCQVYNHFLASFGGKEISCEAFFEIMKKNLFEEDLTGKWAK